MADRVQPDDPLEGLEAGRSPEVRAAPVEASLCWESNP